MGKCILITGGARSGKSTFSENMAKSFGDNVLYIATAVPFDCEMKDRIKKHREKRSKDWITVEAFTAIDEIIIKDGNKYDCIILDCITIMLTNQILEFFNYNMDSLSIEDYNKAEKILIGRINDILKAISLSETTVILVTNEVGWGIVPENLISRAFRDIYGRINQILGKKADELYLIVCGMPMKIKG